MCMYCSMGDHTFKYDPPWSPSDPITPWPHTVPLPISPAPINPWPLEQLKEYLDLLQKVKELEDKIGCPCDPEKPDYLKLLGDRIKHLEKKLAEAAK